MGQAAATVIAAAVLSGGAAHAEKIAEFGTSGLIFKDTVQVHLFSFFSRSQPTSKSSEPPTFCRSCSWRTRLWMA